MKARNRLFGLVIAFVTAACTTSATVGDTVEGRFEPACTMFSGDIVEITGDQYVWKKFTDEIVVDDNGELGEPFPGFPRSGPIRRDGEHMRFIGTDGEPDADFHVKQRVDGVYLLTAEELESDSKDPGFWQCALKLTTP